MNELAELLRLMQQIETSKTDCLVSERIAAGDAELLAALTKHSGQVSEEIMRRVQLVNALADPCKVDAAEKTITLAWLASETGTLVVRVESPEVCKMFFGKWVELGLDDKDKEAQRHKRVSTSPLVGVFSVAKLLQVDLDGQLAGYPCCPTCQIHHVPKDGEAHKPPGRLH